MDSYALYTYTFEEVHQMGIHFPGEEVPTSEKDRNILLDHIFGQKKASVRIQSIKKNGAKKYPCTVLAHKDRVVWLRLENELSLRAYVKTQSQNSDPDPIEKKDIPSNPFSYIFIDCREGRNLIAIKKDSDAWRNTDVEARLLEGNLCQMMESNGYDFTIRIKPETIPKDFWDYNKELIKNHNRQVKKMTIYFTSGSIDPRVSDIIARTPFLKRLFQELWDAPHGKIILERPLGSQIVDGRKRDIKNIIELITSNVLNQNFGLSLLYDNGLEVTCGKDIWLDYPMEVSTEEMLFDTNLFGESRVNEWLDEAKNYIEEQKNGKTTKSARKGKAAKHVQDTSLALDFT